MFVLGGLEDGAYASILVLSPDGNDVILDMSVPWPPRFEPLRIAAGGDRVFMPDAQSHVWTFGRRTDVGGGGGGGGLGAVYARNTGLDGSDLHNRRDGRTRNFQDIAATDDRVFVMNTLLGNVCRVIEFDHDGGLISSTDVEIPRGCMDICMDSDGRHACIAGSGGPGHAGGCVIPLDHASQKTMPVITMDEPPIDVAVTDGHVYVTGMTGMFIEGIG